MRKRYKNAEAGRSRREPQRGRKAGRTRASRAASEACPVLCTRGTPPGWTALRSARGPRPPFYCIWSCAGDSPALQPQERDTTPEAPSHLAHPLFSAQEPVGPALVSRLQASRGHFLRERDEESPLCVPRQETAAFVGESGTCRGQGTLRGCRPPDA